MTDNTENVCDTCEELARVHILERYEEGAPVFRHFCTDCADKVDESTASSPFMLDRHRASTASLLILIGVSLGAMGIAADYIGIPRGSGFGWLRFLGLAIGALLVLVGALIRIDVVGLAGTVIFGLTACVSLFGLSKASGIGWKQQLAVLVGLALMLTGLMLKRRTDGEDGQKDESLTKQRAGLEFDSRYGDTDSRSND